MKRWMPDKPVRKALARPKDIPKFVINRGRDALSILHTALATGYLPLQQDKLVALRSTGSFCLIVLDACRYDALNQVFGTYFRGSIKATKTPARSTFEYLQYNWPETYEYPYVTAAPPVTSERFDFDGDDSGTGLPQESEELYKHYRGYIPANHFQFLVEIWREAWDEELRTCPPEPVTDRAVELADDTEKMVVHYFQPHAPFIGEYRPQFNSISGPEITDPDFKIDSEVWLAAKNSELSKDDLWEFYISNLKRVLAAVVHLVRATTFDQYVVIGDHGEALGEYGNYQHGMEHPYVTTVPWATIADVLDSAPEMLDYSQAATSDLSVQTEKRLQELGYI